MKYINCRWSKSDANEIYFCTCSYCEFVNDALKNDKKCNKCTNFFSQFEDENVSIEDNDTKEMFYE